MADKIPKINANYRDFLNNIPLPVSSLFLSPTNDEEIADVFNTLNAGTACGYDDIKTDVVITVRHINAPYLIHIFNLSIRVSFLHNLRWQKLPQFIKMETRITLANRPIHVSVLSVFSKIVFKRSKI